MLKKGASVNAMFSQSVTRNTARGISIDRAYMIGAMNEGNNADVIIAWLCLKLTKVKLNYLDSHKMKIRKKWR